MATISSLQNERVKHVVKLRENRQRVKDGLMVVEGIYEIEMAIRSGLEPKEIYSCDEMSQGHPSNINLKDITRVPKPVFEKISIRQNPDGWLAVFPIKRQSLIDIKLSPIPFLLGAESLEKPGNLGAMFRTADAAGVDGILICDLRADIYNPNVIRASRGTLFTVPAVETTNQAALQFLRKHMIYIVAATPKASILYTEVDLRKPVCLMMGTEDKGLTEFWMENSDMQVKIPMAGKVNSLNVSTSTAILLYEAVRQRS